MEIEDQGKTTTGELTQLLNLDKSTLSRTIESLVNIGLVERLPHPSDRRFTLITLTEKGKETCEAFNRSNDDYYDRIFERIPQGKREAVIEHFELLVEASSEHENHRNTETKCCNSKNSKDCR